MTNALILTIGDELLIGQVMDTNSIWIAKELNKLGITVRQKMTIPDQKDEILNVLDYALSISEIVIITGGLGPTKDDLTKESLASYFEGKLVQDKEVLAHIHDIFKLSKKTPMFHNLKQAEVPHNCKVLFNQYGTAPGMLFEKQGKIVVSLPGVPFEMKPIFQNSVLPFLEEKFITDFIVHKTLIITGMGESVASDKVSDIEAALPEDFSLAYLPSLGYLRIRLSGKGKDESFLNQMLTYETEKLKLRLGNNCIAEEDISIEEIIAKIFLEKGLTLGIAESCTGGYLSHKITNVPGSSAFFIGSIVSYHNRIKEEMLSVSNEDLTTVGAVSKETVLKMAESTLDVLNVDYALSTSGILGPTGATSEKPVGMVWMGIAKKGKSFSKEFFFRFDRLQNKELAVNCGLDWLREVVLAEEA